MIEQISSAISALKNMTPAAIFAALIASSTLLFLPDAWLLKIGVVEFKALYHKEIGIAFLVSLSLAVVTVLALLRNPFANWYADMKFRRTLKTYLSELSEDEKKFLRRYLNDNVNTVYEPLTSGVANGLQAKHIVYRASQMSVPGNPGMPFAWNLQPVAARLLRKDDRLLK